MKLSTLVMTLALVGFVAHAEEHGAAAPAPTNTAAPAADAAAAPAGDTKEHKDMKHGKKEGMKKKKKNK